MIIFRSFIIKNAIFLLTFIFLITLSSIASAAYQTNLEFRGYLQDGAGDIDAGYYSAPIIYDWNNDGDKDLLVGQNNGNNGYITYYENVGSNSSPTFSSGVNLNAGCDPCLLNVAAGG